jgi:hypothetical protein
LGAQAGRDREPVFPGHMHYGIRPGNIRKIGNMVGKNHHSGPTLCMSKKKKKSLRPFSFSPIGSLWDSMQLLFFFKVFSGNFLFIYFEIFKKLCILK